MTGKRDPKIRIIRPDLASKPVLTLFRMGFDTLDISKAKHEDEPVIYRRLNDALDRFARTREIEKTMVS